MNVDDLTELEKKLLDLIKQYSRDEVNQAMRDINDAFMMYEQLRLFE